MLERAELESAGDVATQALLDAIVDGRIPPGAPLRLKDLSEQLGMSMMPIREAIRRLAALDLVVLEPRRVARVRELSLEDLQDTYFARLQLEGAAVQEAATRFSAEDAERARESLAEWSRAQEAGDVIAARDAHERFHFVLYEASGRGWLVRSILPAWRNSERYRVEFADPARAAKDRASEHRDILAALEAHDQDQAVKLLARHLGTSVTMAAASLGGETARSAVQATVDQAPETVALRTRHIAQI
jgi:DNA-binding GntR family transcriptional regulator